MPAISSVSRARVKVALKAILTVLVLVSVARHVARTWRDLSDRGMTVRVGGAWVAASAGLYLAGLSAFGAYFWRIMEAGAKTTTLAPALRAYLISHLGKYVPARRWSW